VLEGQTLATVGAGRAAHPLQHALGVRIGLSTGSQLLSVPKQRAEGDLALGLLDIKAAESGVVHSIAQGLFGGGALAHLEPHATEHMKGAKTRRPTPRIGPTRTRRRLRRFAEPTEPRQGHGQGHPRRRSPFGMTHAVRHPKRHLGGLQGALGVPHL